jgi:hypothetical protein
LHHFSLVVHHYFPGVTHRPGHWSESPSSDRPPGSPSLDDRQNTRFFSQTDTLSSVRLPNSLQIHLVIPLSTNTAPSPALHALIAEPSDSIASPACLHSHDCIQAPGSMSSGPEPIEPTGCRYRRLANRSLQRLILPGLTVQTPREGDHVAPPLLPSPFYRRVLRLSPRTSEIAFIKLLRGWTAPSPSFLASRSLDERP